MKKFLFILRIVAWSLAVAGAGVLIGFVEVNHFGRTCKEVRIAINLGAADTLITNRDVDSIILRTAGMLKGKPLGYINSAAIERAIRNQPYVAKVSVYEDNHGTLFVDITQRQPLLRIIRQDPSCRSIQTSRPVYWSPTAISKTPI
jgi:cell division protein FtsQ